MVLLTVFFLPVRISEGAQVGVCVGGGQCAGPGGEAGGGRGIGPTGRAPVVVLAVNLTYRKPGGAGSVDVGEGAGSGVAVRSLRRKGAVASWKGGGADRLGEAMSAVEVLAGLEPGGVVEGLRDVVRRAVQQIVPAPTPFSDGSCRAGLLSLLTRRRRWRRSSRSKGVSLKRLGSTL